MCMCMKALNPRKLYSKLMGVGRNILENGSSFPTWHTNIRNQHFSPFRRKEIMRSDWGFCMCECFQGYSFTESNRRKFICWQLIVRIPGRDLQYLHKVFHCELSECERIKTQEIHTTSCRKLILFLSFLYLQAIFASPLSIPEHNNTHKRPESVCSVQHFCLFITGEGRKKGWISYSWWGKSGCVYFTCLSLEPYVPCKCEETYL